MIKNNTIKFSLLIIISLVVSRGHSQIYQESFGGTLTIGMVKKYDLHLNPYNTVSTLDQLVNDIAFKGYLFSSDLNGNIAPQYIDSYKKLNDKTWNFTLKRSIYFHGGKPLLSKDVKATLIYLRNNKNLFLLKDVIPLSNVKKINILGALSFQIILKKADKNFIKTLADIPILPEEYIENFTRSDRKEELRILAGTGPFFISQVNDYTEIFFRVHKNFYGGRPFLNQIHLKFFNNEQKKVTAFINGEVDLIFFNDYSTAKTINQFTGKRSRIYEIEMPYPRIYILLLNQNNPLFKNIVHRKALEFSVNKIALFNQSLKIEKRSFFFSAKSPYYNFRITDRKYDPLKALSILKAEGWAMDNQSRILKKGNMEFNFLLYFDRGSLLQENAARNIQIQLAEIGINVVPIPVDPLEKLSLLNSGQYSAMLTSLPINNKNPLPAFMQLYKDYLIKQLPDLGLFSRQLNTLTANYYNDKISLTDLFQKIHSVFYQNVPAIFLGAQYTQYVAQKASFSNSRYIIKENNSFKYYLSPFENWYVPVNYQNK